jgi:hypothetical protein
MTRAVGWCLEVHDLAAAKLAAGRPKDFDYVKAMVQEKLVSVEVIRERLGLTPNLPAPVLELAMARLDGWEV